MTEPQQPYQEPVDPETGRPIDPDEPEIDQPYDPDQPPPSPGSVQQGEYRGFTG